MVEARVTTAGVKPGEKCLSTVIANLPESVEGHFDHTTESFGWLGQSTRKMAVEAHLSYFTICSISDTDMSRTPV